MNKNEVQARLAGCLLGFLGSYGGIGCIVTGLRFESISLTVIAIFCFITALITAALAGRKLLWVAAAGFFLAGLWSWQYGSLELSLERFLNHISRLYDMGYGWGVIRWSAEPLTAGMAQPVLCALGILLALGICWSFLRCKGIWLTTLLICVPVIPCMVLIDTIPAAVYLFIQFLCLILLLMVRLVRKRNQAMPLFKLLVLPVAAALLVLFISIPQKNYTSFKPVDAFLSYIQELFTDSSKDSPKTPVQQEGSWVNLSAVGPQKHSQDVVMDVTADRSGYLYLKGCAYDTYRGTRWNCTEDAPAVPMPQTNTHSVTVTTRAIHNVLYLPYGTYSIGSSRQFLSEKDGQVANSEGWRSYTVQYRELPDLNHYWQDHSDEILNAYTQLPSSTRRWATEYLARELPELGNISTAALWTRAQAIVRHVSASAVYSLDTPKMPGGTKDFAQWFLEERDTGYCTHFATAATVLLRAAGIPCRYVTGYLVNARSGGTVQVSQDNAHAWVECYIDGIGWVPLEPTPGSGLSETAGGETVVPVETTAPGESSEATRTPDITEPSQITENTMPSGSATVPSSEISGIGGADDPVTDPPDIAATPLSTSVWLRWGMILLCVIGVVIGQWRLRVTLRHKKRSGGRRNAQALARWQEVVLHCRVRKQQPDSRLLELAQKARFSHHTATREELQEFDDWLNASTQTLRSASLWKRFLSTVLFALY